VDGSSIEELELVLGAIDGFEDLAVELQTRLVGVPAISPESGGTGELAKFESFQQALSELIVLDAVERIDAHDPRAEGGVRPNLVGVWSAAPVRETIGQETFAPETPGRTLPRTFWLIAHLDVVPARQEEGWDHDPFTLARRGRQLHGRGAEDDHQGVCSILLAIKALQVLDRRPACDIGVIFVSDEETGNEFGLEFVQATRPELVSSRDVVWLPDGGTPDGAQVQVADKSLLMLRLRIHAPRARSFRPDQGVNCARVAAHLTVRLEELHRIHDRVDSLFRPSTCTFEPMHWEPVETEWGSLPDEEIFHLDCRLLPGVDHNAVVRSVRRIAREEARRWNVAIEVEIVHAEDVPPPCSLDPALTEIACRAVRRAHGVEGEAIGVGIVAFAQEMRKRGIPVIVHQRIDGMAHEVNEYCNLDNLLGDAKVLAMTLHEYLFRD